MGCHSLPQISLSLLPVIKGLPPAPEPTIAAVGTIARGDEFDSPPRAAVFLLRNFLFAAEI